MRVYTLASVLIVATSLFPVAGAGDYDHSTEAWETLVDLELAGRTLEICFENQTDVVFPAEFTTLDEFAKGLPSLYADRLSLRDGWGHEFYVGEALDEIVLLSKGEDGLTEIMDEHGASTEHILDPIEPQDEWIGDDMLFVLGDGLHNGPLSVSSRQQSTMARLRIIATAVEEFFIDNNFYPLQPEVLYGLESVQDDLAVNYPRTLPMNDAWGNPILYWSDQQDYRIVSAGADGILDRAWSDSLPGDVELVGEFSDPNAEIVMGNGSFLQWPATKNRH